MHLTLHEAFVPGCLQMLASVTNLISKAKLHCATENLQEAELIQARIAPDMLDFAYQVKSCAVHSLGAIRGVQAGNFSPDMAIPPDNFEGLRSLMEGTISELQSVTAAEMDDLSEKHMTFTIGEKLRWDFVGKDFLLSFSQPNLYFHATTAYDILRQKGVKIGKADYLGAVRKQ